MKTKVAINGFGRIGRLALRNLHNSEKVEVVAINDLTDTATLAHLLKYDSAHRQFMAEISHTEKSISINGQEIKVFAERNPENLPWADLGVHTVLECTGVFRDETGMGKHLTAGAGLVILSAPAKGNIKTVVLGVNDETLVDGDQLLSNASCTTNCLAPMMKVLEDNFGVVKGYMTTIHAYTADQRLQDAPHSDLRRARAAALSMIPTTTGAAVAVGKVLPALKGKLDGYAMRVPIITGSATDVTVELKQDVTAQQINAAMKTASEGAMKGILQYTEEPLVSVDIIDNKHSVIFDSGLTSANGNMIKIMGWYDNEAGYATRLTDLCEKLA